MVEVPMKWIVLKMWFENECLSMELGSEHLTMRKSTKGIVLMTFTMYLFPSIDKRGRGILAEHNCYADNYTRDPLCVDCNSLGCSKTTTIL